MFEYTVHIEKLKVCKIIYNTCAIKLPLDKLFKNTATKCPK